jgi:carboxypeptidase T
MRSFFITITCIFVSYFTIFAQIQEVEKYSKIRIDLTDKNIQLLTEAGLETDHGIFVKNRYFINDFSASEIKLIQSLGFRIEVLLDDVSSFYASENRKSELEQIEISSRGNCDGIPVSEYNYKTPDQYKAGSMGGYFTYREMLDIIDSMSARYPHIISNRKNIDAIKTHDGNQLFYVKVSDLVLKDEEAEPEVLYTALHHAREPNGLSQMIFYLWYLLENYGKDPVVTKIVDNTQMYFIPCVNPDGYIHNQNTNPNGGGLWRKNMWKDTLGDLKGVDLNRNYGHFWGFNNSGSSSNPNSQTYRGPDAFSEPETQAVRAFCSERNFIMALNYHTFGNYLIHPWGYNDLPADEDALFKTIGQVMNRENNFLLGTGIETVGYTVNGGSDDWMYGDKGEKNAIYSLTPEVGPSFWPASADIDYLNKSCVWMNLSAALLTLNYYEAKETNESDYLTPESKNIFVRVSRAGLKDGSASIVLTSRTPGIDVVQPYRMVTLKSAEYVDLIFELMIDPSKSYADGIMLSLEVDNDGIKNEKEIRKQWISKPFSTLYFNDLTTIDAFNSDGWVRTNTLFFSQPSSVTDSENGNYPPDHRSFITLKEPIDLSDVSHAFLSFFARWDIEQGYDYVQVLASSDNNDFIPLCGKYTRPGTRDQVLNSPLYDGVKNEWVNEEIDLSIFTGKPRVWIRFALNSDQYTERDGFYFDELEVRAVQNVSGTDDGKTPLVNKLFPNLWSGQMTVYAHGVPVTSNNTLTIHDVMGRTVGKYAIHAETFEVDASHLSNGIYTYEWSDGNLKIATGKVVVIHDGK